MNSARRSGITGRRRRARRRAVRGRVGVGLAAAVAVTVLGAGCASFPDATASFGAQPSLTPKIATVVTPTPPSASPRTTPETTTPESPGDPASSVPTSSQSSADPCAPSMPPVIATCLDAPWGLAVLPGGQAALVGERTTGKILKVTAGKEPELVARVTGLDTSGGGGLLGIALSPYYTEDSLIYAYITTRTDNRIVRIAPGQKPKAIFTGIPAGDVHNGGPIAFGADDLLYVATGDAGDPAAPADPGSLAGKVLRLDAYGNPAGAGSADGTQSGGSGAPSTADTPGTTEIPENPETSGTADTAETARGTTGASPRTTTSTPTTPPDSMTGTARTTRTAGTSTLPAVYASGFTDPTGICPLPGQRIGTVDHRATGDLLIPVASGRDYTHPGSGDTLWVYQAGDGGAVDCAVSGGYLMASSLAAKKVTSIQMTPTGGFTGSPNDLATNEFGRLRTIVTGQDDLVWLTTSNKDGHGKPTPSDDRVVVLPAGGGGGSGGVD